MLKYPYKNKEEKGMDSLVFRIARKVCLLAFGTNIFIHAVIGASTVNGIVKGSLSMGVMLILLVILSRYDLNHRITKSRKKRQKIKDEGDDQDE